MKKIEFLTSFELTDYIDSWRMAAITEENFNIVLTHLNLTEFKDFNAKELYKVNKSICICLFLESPFKEKTYTNSEIKGVIASKTNALLFMRMTLKVIDDLLIIYKKSEKGITSDICSDLKYYLMNKRGRNEYLDQLQDDQELIHNGAFLNVFMFADVRDKLKTKDSEILNNATIYLTIDSVDFAEL